MKDQYGRDIDYLRVSITDRCNLRCRYCMPDGIEWLPMEEILSLEEVTEACRQAAALGIRKIKVTGGEPLVRRGCTGSHRYAERPARYRAGHPDHQRNPAGLPVPTSSAARDFTRSTSAWIPSTR